MELDEILAECAGFQWDAGNSTKNWLSHQVTSAECEQVFFNYPFIVNRDDQHSANEKRYYALGQSDSSRFMFVVFTLRGRLIRVISARDMSRREREVFRSS